MPFRKFCSILLQAVVAVSMFASTNPTSQRVSSVQASLAARETRVRKAEIHGSEFADIRHTSRGSCAANQPPEALATPNPLLDEAAESAKVTVSFIIGTDGRVHSPFVLESAGPVEDRTVLYTVSSWRYRPATCNGVPTEAEAKVEFSSR
jgi:TonB family protein